MDGFLQVHYTSLIQYDKDFINHIYFGPILVDSELTFLILMLSHVFCCLMRYQMKIDGKLCVIHSFPHRFVSVNGTLWFIITS